MTGTDGILIRPLRGIDEYRACVRLQEEIWGGNFTERVPPAMLMVAQELGGVASGAWDGDRLVGFVFGVTGLRGGRLAHWSDMLAVRPEYRNRGLGRRLKLHQRDEVLARGVETVHWTFEPLESRNAYLNFAKLAVTVREYRRDLYGEPDSPLHQGLGTDRFVVDWAIDSDRVRARIAGTDRPPTAADVQELPVANPTRPGAGGLTCEAPDTDLDVNRLRVAIPAEIQVLKAQAPEPARAWRTHVRAAMESYLEREFVVMELVRESDERSCYVLERAVLPR